LEVRFKIVGTSRKTYHSSVSSSVKYRHPQVKANTKGFLNSHRSDPIKASATTYGFYDP